MHFGAFLAQIGSFEEKKHALDGHTLLEMQRDILGHFEVIMNRFEAFRQLSYAIRVPDGRTDRPSYRCMDAS